MRTLLAFAYFILNLSPASAEALSVPVPMDKTQVAFEGIITTWREAYAEADPARITDDLAQFLRQNMRRERDQDLCTSMPLNMDFDFIALDWIGTISELRMSSDGAILSVRLLPYLTLATRAPGIKPTDDVYSMIRNLREGQRVRFSGSFPEIDRKWCFSETSPEDEKSMTRPDFDFAFTDVESLW